MSGLSRSLQRTRLSPESLELLLHHSLFTCKDVLTRNEIELVQLLDIDIFSSREIIYQVSSAVCPVSRTLLDIFKEKNSNQPRFLRTSLSLLDQCLSGGIPIASITEIVGPSGAGKTQFCHMLSVIATMPLEHSGLNGSVLYFDTEMSFSAERIAEIAKAIDMQFFSSSENLLKLFLNIIVFPYKDTCSNLITKMEKIDELIIEKKVKLIIIDSIASLAKMESELQKRQALLSKLASVLKFLAESFAIPIVLTNQVISHYGDDKVFNSVPALGTLWSHSVNTRLVLEIANDNSKRKMIIAKSPISPVNQFLFQIDRGGISCCHNSKETVDETQLENSNNFWEIQITKKTETSGRSSVDSQHYLTILKQSISKKHYQ